MNNKSHKLTAIGLFVVNLLISQNVFGSSAGISGYSTNPNTNAGNSCVFCHSGGTAPVVNLSGPTSVQPGSISTYTLTISGGQENSGGFNTSADAGTLISTLASTKLLAGELTHSQQATAAGDGTVSWDFNWQAPTTGGSYTIYSAGLSTNADASTTGDAVDTLAYTVTVSAGAAQAPTAVITAPLTAEVNSTVNFDGSASFDPDGVINQYDWDFGDGNTATGAQAINTFTAAGTYTVTLTVTDSDNLPHTTFQDITVGGTMIPIAVPTGPGTAIVNQPVNFDGSQSSHVEAITNYIWDFGDGSDPVQSSSSTISHTYTQLGTYTVTLAVQDANNITGVGSTTVIIESESGTPTPLDGPQLYSDNCATCHGTLASSAKLNRTASQIQGAIDANTGNMGGLSSLLPDEIQAIADALVSTTPVTDGPTLYATNCASCHGDLATSAKLNRTASQIQGAIDADTGNMGSLSGLSTTQIQAIADALVSTDPPITDGPTLYANNCATCHGDLATSAKLNRTASQIQGAIDANTGEMGSLSTLTSTQVQAIADALVSTSPPPTDGATLYTNNCATCHGALATSAKLNRTASQIQGAIDANTGNMGSLSSLTASQVQAIADALVSTDPPPMPTTGKGLYDTFCLACHGPAGKGGLYEAVTGESASEIQEAIDDEPEMNSISLNSTQLRKIADYLSGKDGGGGMTPAPTDGATLYTTNCATCHGDLATSTKLNRTASQIQGAIDANTGNMGNLSNLTTTQVQAIADALAGGSGTIPPTATTGEQLYINQCQGCHGLNGTGGSAKAVIGVSASQITNAIAGIGSMQSITLTATEAQDIADFLSSGGGTQAPPTTGEGIYALKCAACHGPGGTGGSEEAVTGASLSEIQEAMIEVPEMQPIPLTNGEAQALESYLSGGQPDDCGYSGYGGYGENCDGEDD